MLLPVLNVRWGDFDKKNLQLLFGTGFWNFIYQAGFILFLNVDMVVANQMLSLDQAGAYGALLAIPKNLRILAVAIGGVWGPSILSKFSSSDHRGIDRIMQTSIKITGLMLALLIGLICGLADPFLPIWLGQDFKPMAWILVVMTFPLSTNLIDRSFFNIQVTLNKLKFPAVVTFGLSILNLLLAILLTPRFGVMGLVLAGVLTVTLNYSIFAPVYAAIIMQLPWWHYLKSLGRITLTTLGVAVFSYLLRSAIPLSTFPHLIVVGGLISVGYSVLVYFWGLSTSEKNVLGDSLHFKKKTNA